MFFKPTAIITRLALIFSVMTIVACQSSKPTPSQDIRMKGPRDRLVGVPSGTLSSSFASQKSQKRLALVIGNSNYQGHNFLSNPVNDAEDLAGVLRRLGFDVMHRSNLDQAQMETAINQFMDKLRQNKGVGLFYFSGHGVQHGGENYLIPVGATSALSAASQLRYKAVAAGFVLASMKAASNETNIIVLDACRSAPFKSWFKGSPMPQGLSAMSTVPGALVAYAASPGGVAMNGTGRNSPYVKHLMAWMVKPQLSLTKILRNVRRAVHQETHGAQSPGYYDELNESFYFNPQPAIDPLAEQAKLQAERDRLAQERAAATAALAAEQARIARDQEALRQAHAQLQVDRERAKLRAEREHLAQQQQAARAALAAEQARIARDQETLRQAQAQLQAEQERHASQPSTPVTRPIEGPKMVWIPAGSFRMGDIQGGGGSNEKPVHSVSVRRFAMSRYEVTVGEFRQFVNATGYKTDAEKQGSCWTSVGDGSGKNWRNLGFSQNDNHPVVCVSWNDATAYAVWLSRQTGHTYRLPTEAQWEYAARAGTTTSRYWGNNPDEACRYANVADKTAKTEYSHWTIHNCTDGYAQTAPVGSFEANNFGLFDMLGNAWEWTCSAYDNKYNGKESQCMSEKGGLRALRGGAWSGEPRSVRAANRGRLARDARFDIVGFRLARL